MTLTNISSAIARATRFKMHPDQIREIMDMTQKQAFDSNSLSFLVWSEVLTAQFVLAFDTSGYTSAIAGDIGKTVVGATSGSTGTLVSYENTEKTWVIDTTEEFDDGEAITITTGTGAGSLDSTDGFYGYVGPYAAPTDPPCRKIWGVTTATDANIFGLSDPTLFPMNDFDFIPNQFDPSRFFKPGRENNLDKTFTFGESPSLDTVYRWVYWRDGVDIDDFSAETVLQIPARYHMNYVNACVKNAQIMIAGEDVDPKVIQALFQPWWNTLLRPYTPMGRKSNQTLGAYQGNRGIII